MARTTVSSWLAPTDEIKIKMGVPQILRKIISTAVLVTCSNAFVSSRLQVIPSGNRVHDSQSDSINLGVQVQPPSLSSTGRAAKYGIRFNSRGNDPDLGDSVGGNRSHGRRPSIGALQTASGVERGVLDNVKDRTGLRRAALLGLWLSSVAYLASVFLSLPGVPALNTNAGDGVDFLLGIVDGASPLSYAATSCVISVASSYGPILVGGGAFRRGRQVVPAFPVMFFSSFLGFLVLGPYLALRKYTPEGDGEEAGLLEKLVTNKVTSAAQLGFALYSAYLAVAGIADATARQTCINDFWTSAVSHFTIVDLALLSSVVVDPIREDMRRRGWHPSPARVAPFLVPVIGPALWLVFRPPVVANGDQVVDGTG